MFIQDSHVEGFRSFGEPVDLRFGANINVVIGPNGSGKSNLIEALAFVLQVPK